MSYPIQFRPFTTYDWYGYAGCDRFPDGSEPLICDDGITVDGHPAIIVIDSNGMSIDIIPDDAECVVTFEPANVVAALAYLAGHPTTTKADLLARSGALNPAA